jgi:hypothetical protein
MGDDQSLLEVWSRNLECLHRLVCVCKGNTLCATRGRRDPRAERTAGCRCSKYTGVNAAAEIATIWHTNIKIGFRLKIKKFHVPHAQAHRDVHDTETIITIG